MLLSRQLAWLLQRDRARLRLALGQLMRERLSPVPSAGQLPGDQRLADIHRMAHLMPVASTPGRTPHESIQMPYPETDRGV